MPTLPVWQYHYDFLSPTTKTAHDESHLVDAGPLVALLNAGDRQHASIARQLALVKPPSRVDCVLTAGSYLLHSCA